ncbi:hypothetical protein GJAV_G00044810 [Gymnothorax javanicus]|nr:hypothetical protein GJAV_G00044810 [Gymnothorax javanicus]
MSATSTGKLSNFRMMRRSRISVRPNLRPVARSVTSSQDGQPSPAAGDTTPTTESEEVQLATVKMTKTRDKPAASEQQLDNTETKETGQSGSDSSSSLLQRRKRFSAMPNLAKTRVSIASARMAIRVPKSPPPKVPNPLPAETAVQTSSDNSTAPNIRSPRWRRASGSGKPPRIQSKLGPLSPSALAAAKQAPPPSTAPASSPTTQGSGEKEASSPLQADLEKSSPEEKPRTDPSSVSVVPSQRATADVKSSSSLPTAVQSITSEKERIAKLREILKQERTKLKRYKKGKSHFCEHSVPQDHNKMTMRDLIYYLPESNPMKSYPAEETGSAEKVLPSSPNKVLPEKPQEVRREDEEQEAEEGRQGDEPADDDQLVVPRVKVAEDGTLILDEESLTVEVSRTKGPNLAEENDPIFERGSSTTYSSFRKSFYAKPWSIKETEMFFLAISMVGTDFSLIGQLFPHRARTEIKNKYKKEERENSVRVDKAFKEKRRFDLECFTKLLERILAEEKDRKKSKIKDSVGQKKKTRTRKGRKAANKRGSGDQSSEEELDADVVEGDSEMAEKENEDCSNVVESRANLSPVKLTCKRKSLEDEETLHGKSAHTRSLKKRRTEDEGALAEDCDSPICGAQPTVPDVDRLKKPEGSRPSRVQPEIKPALLSRGRFHRPTPNLGARSAKKNSQAGEKSGDVESYSSQGDEVSARQEQNTKKPPREGQRPPEKEESTSESSSASPESPKGDAARGQARQQAGARRRPKARPNVAVAQRNARRGKSKLVTLRASVPDDEEDEPDEAHPEEEDFGYNVNPEEQNQVPAFVPVSLRSPQPVPMEVEETVEELEISMNMCDVVDSAESETALCVQAVCSGAQDELALSTEHHLDLLVDVIEFLSSDSVDGSEESYNEAARTLLTIRNPELLSLAAPAYNREVVITEEPHHVPLDETEPDENFTAGSADHLENGSEQPQKLSSGVPAPEISQSAAQPAYDRDSTSVTHVEEVKPESVRTETASPSCESNIMGDTAVSEESRSQERAEPASSGDGNDGVSGPKPSVLTVQPGRRSRFPKPKPNLARTARTSRVTSTQCAEGSAAAGPVELEPLKTAQVEGRMMDHFPSNQVQERQEDQRSDQTRDSSVGGSLGKCTGPELSKQSLPHAGRVRHFPKCRPVLGVAERDTSVSAAPATEGESRSSGIREADRLTEDETSANGGTGMRVEVDKDEGTALSENQLSEEQAEMNVLLETGETNADNSIAAVKEKCPEDEVEKSHQTSVRTDQRETENIHLEDDLGAAVTCLTTEDQQPSLILSLFEVSPPLLGELDSAADPPSTISAELLSPLVFVDEQLQTSFARTEPHCCDPLNAASVEMGEDQGQGSHPLNAVSVEMEAEKGQGSHPLNAVSVEMEAEKGQGSHPLNAVSVEMEAEKEQGSHPLNAVSVEMEAEKGQGPHTLNAVSVEMEAEKGQGPHPLNAVSVEMEAEKEQGSHPLNAVSVEMEAEKEQGSHPLNAVSVEMEAEKEQGSHPLNAVSVEMEAEKGQGPHTLNAVSVEMEAEKGQGSRPLVPAYEEQEDQHDHGSKLGGTEPTMDVSSNTVASPVNSCGDGLLKSNSSALHPEDSPEDVQTISKTQDPLPCTDQQSSQATLLHSIALQHSCTEAATKPEPSATENLEYFVLPTVDTESSSNSKCPENSTAGVEPHVSQQAVPMTSGGPTTRTGRKPRGFLSFISDKGTARSASAPRSARPACLRPQVNAARPGRRAPAASTLPSRASAANAQAADNSEPAANSQTAPTFATDQVSTSAHEESLSLKNSKAAEEPTSVSEYFFSDIFTQVEEPE